MVGHKFKYSLFLITCFISSFTYSQETNFPYNFIPVEEDFTQRAITVIVKDKDNFMWFGTYGDGLFRYNGNDFKNYKQKGDLKAYSLNSSIIRSLLVDKQNLLWVGSENGLNLYNKNLDRFDNIKLINNGKIEQFPVQAITEYDNETLLIGTYGGGLYKLNKKDFKYQLIPYERRGLLINSIIKSPSGRFLIGTNYGLTTFVPNREILQLAKFKTKDSYTTINNGVESLLVTKDNSVWIGTFSSGLLKISENNKGTYTIEEFKVTKKRILSLAEKSNSNILCGTENDGLFEINYATGNIKNYKRDKLKSNGIKSNSIWSTYIDSKNRIWLGYYNNGIDVHDDNYNKFGFLKNHPYETNSLNSNSVTGIIKDEKERFWIGTIDGGVDVYDPLKKTYTNLANQNNPIAKGLNCLDIQTIFIDSKKNIWIGTWDFGLFMLKHGEKKFININSSSLHTVFTSNRIMSFDEDSKGTIWIGSFFGGLYSYNPSDNNFKHMNSQEFVKYNINTRNIRKVLVDNKDNIWLGTRSGLIKIKQTTNSNYQVSSLNYKINKAFKDSPEYSIIVSIFEDREKELWFGTIGNGLYRYNTEKDSIKWYNVNNGLIHQTVASISQDTSGTLWIGGNTGLSKLNLNNNSFTNFNKKDGLLSNDFNYNAVYKSTNNVLYFGNSKGINYFNPDKIVYNKEKPLVYLTDLKIANVVVNPKTKNSPLKKVITKSTEITLDHNQSSFSLGYVGINYTRSKNNQYAYYLEGFDEDWNYVGTARTASFKNIPSGTYTFKVKASNNDGVWNDVPTELRIEILSPWWTTKLAVLSYIFLTLLLSYLIYKTISERIKERRILNLERQEYKQYEALNVQKIHFFTNISHEFRTPLTLILSPLESIIEDEDLQVSNELKEKHNIIFKNAKRLSRLINELMDFRKLQFNKMSINASKINVIPFIKEVTSHFEEEASLKNIILSVDYNEDNISIWSDPSMLEKIIFNLLSNAFKATPEGGFITIQINKPKHFILLPLVDENNPVPVIEIIIKDTGIGIKEKNIEKVFDRFYQVNEMNDQYYGGTGIGLELVKSFVDLHKGKIELTSKENTGTQFTIYIPLGYSHLKEENINKNDKKAINQYSEAFKDNLNEEEFSNKKTVLIVEDNIELRTYLKNELKNEYQVKEAENGLEGLEKANEFIPDIIITDVMMPIMDGFEFCERIKTNLKTSHIPLLMVTAKGMQIDKVKGIDSGADVYLNKPFNLKVLKSHLKQLISSRQILFDKYFNGIDKSIVSDSITSLDKKFINNVLRYINDNISDEKLNVESLAGELLLSRSKLYRKIKALTGDTANEFIRKVRLEKAKQLIENSEFTIGEICYKVGFSSPSYFTKCFKNYFDIVPTEIREAPSRSQHLD